MDEVWEIVPGKKIGPFALGATIADVLFLLKKRTPCRAIEIFYCEDEPYAIDIVINSPEDGIKFKFDAVSQLLVAIEVYTVNMISLRYHSELVFGKGLSATFLSIYQLFGPTYPGTFDTSTKVYSLHYMGCAFQFPIPSQYKAKYEQNDTLPMELPNGATPAAISFSIYGGSDMTQPEPPVPLKPFYFDEVVALVSATETVTCLFTKSKRTLRLGATPQEVASELGAPASTYYKAVMDNAKPTGDYFHNYPELGLDLLYTPHHTLAKIVLRTNVPGSAYVAEVALIPRSHSEFSAYLKCNFRIEQLTAEPTFPVITPQTPVGLLRRVSPQGVRQWSDIQAALGTASRPTVLDNGSASDPFGASFFYTIVPGCVVEVLSNDAIASVTLSHALRQV
ncbi:hypothetical protein ACHHYP_08279 [Achlya hypogyna]|uniref:Uncharacterized protein n=1 Tax=Achlya hypogyna TaxID=1202772 RepID=A0A1V9ZLQ0_ACHHY|nr:hypothetical protein ACHHYP_08279 [Achlya hypogyna]